jgi:integrase
MHRKPGQQTADFHPGVQAFQETLSDPQGVSTNSRPLGHRRPLSFPQGVPSTKSTPGGSLKKHAPSPEAGSDFVEIRAPRRPFTDRYLASLKATSRRYEVFDPGRQGLLIRVTPNGVKTFCFRYQRNGKPVRIMIGRYPAISLRIAYETHADLLKKLHRGEAPRNHAALGFRGLGVAAEPMEPALTVGDLAKEFAQRYLQRERKHPREAELTIQGNIVRYWRNRPAASIIRRDGVLLLDRIVDRNAPVMANRVAALLSQMFRFGVERGMLEASPFVSMPRPGGTEKGRRRKLDEREVRIFWKKLTRSKLNAEVRIALKLILVTAQRPGEVAFAAWNEFDIERRIWTIPAERSKNGQQHEVPLSDLALTLIRHLRRRFGETEFLIPSRCWRARGGAPITVRALSQGIRDRRAHFALSEFTPHDLRRTAASLMTANGIPRLHVEKVLNHTIDDVAEIYDRHDYTKEKRVALDRLAQTIRTLLNAKQAIEARKSYPAT